MEFNSFIKEHHTNMVAHGFWDEPRSYKKIAALFHEELTEALGEDRTGKPLVYFYKRDRMSAAFGEQDFDMCTNLALHDKEKPEGKAVELADFILRVLDYLGSENVDFDSILAEFKEEDVRVETDFADFITDLHSLVTYTVNEPKVEYKRILFAEAFTCIYKWARLNGIDMDAVIMMKHEYNKTRPYKHGKKY